MKYGFYNKETKKLETYYLPKNLKNKYYWTITKIIKGSSILKKYKLTKYFNKEARENHPHRRALLGNERLLTLIIGLVLKLMVKDLINNNIKIILPHLKGIKNSIYLTPIPKETLITRIKNIPEIYDDYDYHEADGVMYEGTFEYRTYSSSTGELTSYYKRVNFGDSFTKKLIENVNSGKRYAPLKNRTLKQYAKLAHKFFPEIPIKEFKKFVYHWFRCLTFFLINMNHEFNGRHKPLKLTLAIKPKYYTKEGMLKNRYKCKNFIKKIIEYNSKQYKPKRGPIKNETRTSTE